MTPLTRSSRRGCLEPRRGRLRVVQRLPHVPLGREDDRLDAALVVGCAFRLQHLVENEVIPENARLDQTHWNPSACGTAVSRVTTCWSESLPVHSWQL